MIPMTLDQIAAVVDGEVHGEPGTTVTGEAYVDTRTPVVDGLFVAVVGERVDGHDFAAGAHAVLGTRPTAAPTVVVADAVTALGRLARHVIDTVSPTVLALTGSQGKTGTKDYLAQVLATAGHTVATAGNFNNEIGVPLTVLRADRDTRFLVVEMGARGIGHIRHLCEVATPTIAAVLNVGTAHLSEFGSRESIAQAKGEIVECLPPDGVAVLNADDELVAAMRGRTPARVVTFGELDPDAPHAPTLGFHAVQLDDLGRPSATFQWHDPAAGETVGTRLQLREIGRHQLTNAAAAATMALAAGVGFADIVAALAQATSRSRWRMELHERGDGLVVVNDAYNANPASMAAAIDTLTDIAAHRSGRAIAVLGEMLELGHESAQAHRDVGSHLAAAGVDVLVTVGEQAGLIARGAAESSGWAGATVETAGRDEALAWVRHNVAPEDVVLVKASRGAALEQVAEGLLGDEEGDPSR
jgi:UDP-N-acetylmuramoyl-tripeptide--D-alanyl-D-alanine ligase